jgi:hypothetical protein
MRNDHRVLLFKVWKKASQTLGDLPQGIKIIVSMIKICVKTFVGFACREQRFPDASSVSSFASTRFQ